MGFKNEKISEEDLETYGIREIDKNAGFGKTFADDWTIDRDKNIYLRRIARGREDTSHFTKWTFFWDGTALTVMLKGVHHHSRDDGQLSVVEKLVQLDLPEELRAERENVLEDLRSALQAYKANGVYSSVVDYQHTLVLDS